MANTNPNPTPTTTTTTTTVDEYGTTETVYDEDGNIVKRTIACG